VFNYFQLSFGTIGLEPKERVQNAFQNTLEA